MPNVTAGFALETQTRPFYGPGTFRSGANVSVVVHELAHQWYGDSVSVEGWKDIWINEGFARYSQWLWSEKEGEGTARELADWAYALRPAEDAFWQVKPGDPGPDNQFHGAVYDRGAIALQALRNEIGDERFFEILKGWPTERPTATPGSGTSSGTPRRSRRSLSRSSSRPGSTPRASRMPRR